MPPSRRQSQKLRRLTISFMRPSSELIGSVDLRHAAISKDNAMIRYLRLPQVISRVSLSPMTIWRRERDGSFPRRVQLSPNSVAWIETEVETWCAERAAERDRRHEAQPSHESA
ncbi:MAG TPA: AlpA family phage regulatory protein [Stellaceae bacterium]|nr:AlpA family phage regulatory protein [Stellaceae bacterium]